MTDVLEVFKQTGSVLAIRLAMTPIHDKGLTLMRRGCW
jgi:hypothetical protein